MKKIFDIFIHDVKTIFTNYAAFIVILALCILPSLYAWFNIKASWNPYGKESTSGIKIAVVNLDQGTTLNGEKYNVGQQVVDELKKNDQLGWQFLSAKEARSQLENEKIYAIVTLTQDFSESLVSIMGTNIRKGEIIYMVNEKMNAIAPKLTDKGVTNLQNMISQTVIETISDTVFTMANELGVNLKEQIPNLTSAYHKLQEIVSRFDEVNSSVKEADTGIVKLKALLKELETQMPMIKDSINKAQNLGTQVNDFLQVSESSVEKIAPTILKDLNVLSQTLGNILTSIDGFGEAAAGQLETLAPIASQMQSKITSYQSLVKSMIQILTYFNELSDTHPFTKQIEILQTTSSQLNTVSQLITEIVTAVQTNGVLPQDKVAQLRQIVANQQAVVNQVTDTLNNELIPKLKVIFGKADSTLSSVNQMLNRLEARLPEITNMMKTANSSIKKGEDYLTYVNEYLPKIESYLTEFLTKLQEANTEEGLKELIRLLTADVKSRSDFLSAPVEITQEVIYPTGNYGSGMAPFYTVLSLWVGVLLLTSMLTVNVLGDYRPFHIYFGKWLTYVSICLIQALIASLGDLYLLRIYCVNPFLFVIGNLFAAIVFGTLVYSLVSVFGNVGKVIAIILMVLQVAGSGGTFPIQLTPKFFQVLNPFLPFTYAISFNREAIGGVVQSVLIRDTLVLLGIFVGTIVISVLIKKPINKLTSRFVHKFEESKLSEH